MDAERAFINDNGLIPAKREVDPNGFLAQQPGAKMDAGKIPVAQGVLQYFPRALTAVAEVSQIGARKYSWKGWEKVPDGINRYTNALARHLLAMDTEGTRDADTGCLHLAQVAWNALAALELTIREQATKVGCPIPGCGCGVVPEVTLQNPAAQPHIPERTQQSIPGLNYELGYGPTTISDGTIWTINEPSVKNSDPSVMGTCEAPYRVAQKPHPQYDSCIKWKPV